MKVSTICHYQNLLIYKTTRIPILYLSLLFVITILASVILNTLWIARAAIICRMVSWTICSPVTINNYIWISANISDMKVNILSINNKKYITPIQRNFHGTQKSNSVSCMEGRRFIFGTVVEGPAGLIKRIYSPEVWVARHNKGSK